MAHDLSIASCTVYIWNPKGVLKGLWGSYWETEGTRVGHSAIRIGDGAQNIYLSFWPSHAPKSSGINSYVAGYMQNNNIPANQFDVTKEWAVKQDFVLDEDAEHEGSKPDQKFRFTAGLDWSAMIAKAKLLRNEVNSYSFLGKNCTRAVAEVLQAGKPPVAVPLTGWVTNTWQPGDLSSYCQKLKTEINKANAGAAIEKVDKVWQ